jgi:hypothetical protein
MWGISIGPQQIPHEFVDVYLQPLVDELLSLWNGVPAIDGSIPPTEDQNFTLYAMLLWTMHDWQGKTPFITRSFITSGAML